MKVLHVYKTFFPDTHGGLEEVIRQICLNGEAHGLESRVFALSPEPGPGPVEVNGVTVVRARRSFEIASCGFCVHGLSEFRKQVAWADVVHYHYPWPFADVMYLLYGRAKPSIVTYHSDIVRQRILQVLYRPLRSRFLGSASRIVATSPNYSATSKVLDRFADRVEVIPIGIDESRYPHPPEARQLREIRAAVGEDFFLFVGVLRYYKGLHILLEAVKDASYRVVIVGDGPVEQTLKRHAARLKLDNVVFCGYVDDAVKMALFHLCLGVVFPTCVPKPLAWPCWKAPCVENPCCRRKPVPAPAISMWTVKPAMWCRRDVPNPCVRGSTGSITTRSARGKWVWRPTAAFGNCSVAG